MLVEVARDVEQPAVLPAQVVEVQGAFLGVCEGGVGDGEHCLADDPGLDQAAGVDADDARAVGERVEVPRARLACIGLLAAGRPDDRVGVAEVDAHPLGGVLRVGAHEHAHLRELRPDGGEPATDELDLVGCDERRGAEVEDVGLSRVQRNPPLELLARRARPPLEPVVEPLRAGEDDPVARDPVHLLELLPLDVVPDEDAVGHEAQQALAGQVVPARDADARADPERPRRLQVLDLRRGELDHGARKHGVGLLGGEELGDPAARRDRVLVAREPRDRLPGELGVGAGCQARDPLVQRSLEGLRQAAVVDSPVELVDEAAAEGGRVGVAGVAVAGEVGQRAHEPADAAPAVAASARRRVRVRDVRVLSGQLLDQLEVAGILLQPPERDVHLVPPLCEQPDRLAEVAQVAGVEEREDELQAGRGGLCDRSGRSLCFGLLHGTEPSAPPSGQA